MKHPTKSMMLLEHGLSPREWVGKQQQHQPKQEQVGSPRCNDDSDAGSRDVCPRAPVYQGWRDEHHSGSLPWMPRTLAHMHRVKDACHSQCICKNASYPRNPAGNPYLKKKCSEIPTFSFKCSEVTPPHAYVVFMKISVRPFLS